MAQDIEQNLKEQLGKITEDLTRMQQEINDLRAHVSRLEQERAQAAAESLETSF